MIEHPSPTDATAKYLYAHAYRCAYEGCQRPLYRVDEQTGARTLNSRICHVNARRENGPRWDPLQSADDNRSEQNLVLMCIEHASAIDDPATVYSYSAERLHEWKSKQFEEYNQLKQGWIIDTDMALEAIAAPSSNVKIVLTDSVLTLGGEGGKSPGAGGGGGGAIGQGARAGRGGDGGADRIDSGKYALRYAEDASRPSFMELLSPEEGAKLKVNPGAGGGGAGVMGEGATAGDGGGGGDRITACIDLVELQRDGLDRVEVTVGAGAPGVRLPGQHGKNGEDSLVKFVAADGILLKELHAPGGQGGRSGDSFLPDGVVELLKEDIDNGFRVTTLMPVNAVEFREHLMFVLGGGWVRYNIPQVPFDQAWVVVCAARWRVLEGGALRGLFLSLFDPTGHEVACVTFIVPAAALQEGVTHWARTIGATFDAGGVWTLRVHSGGFLLAEFDVQVAPQKN